MSTWTIRPARIPDDAYRVIDLINLNEPEPMPAEELARHWAIIPEGGTRHRLIAEDETGAVLACGGAARDPWDQQGRWFVRVTVRPEARGQGLGSGLLETIEGMIRPVGATVLSAEVRESDPESLAWTRARGFRVDRHLFESTLDLTAFDETPFAGVVEAAEATGIRFFTLADEPGEATLRRYYALVSRTVFDIPGVNIAAFPPFADWMRNRPTEEEVSADCQIFAADGDRIVGATILANRLHVGAMYTNHTSVDREYRGRQIALALKLLSARTARRYGAVRMRTNNDSTNVPMLTVNRKLGYRPEPGVYLIEKAL